MTWSLDITREADGHSYDATLELSDGGDVLFFVYGSRGFEQNLRQLWSVWYANLRDARAGQRTLNDAASLPAPRIDSTRLGDFSRAVQSVFGWSCQLRWNAPGEFTMLDEVQRRAQTDFNMEYPLTAAWHEAAKKKESDMVSNTIWGRDMSVSCDEAPTMTVFPPSITVTGVGTGIVTTSAHSQLQTEPAHGVGPFTAVPYGVMFALYQAPGVARRVEMPVLHVDADGWAQVMGDSGQLMDADDYVARRGEQTYTFERVEYRAPR